jgi:hypothetical protein
MGIRRFNVMDEEYFGDNVYLIHRPFILSNPYTHIKDKQTKAMFVVNTREEAIERYSHYYDIMYGKNIKFTQEIDEIYEKYRRGEDILLGCYCSLKEECHGDIIMKKLQGRLVKEKFEEIKKSKAKHLQV